MKSPNDLVKLDMADIDNGASGAKKAFIGRAIDRANRLYDAELTAASVSAQPGTPVGSEQLPEWMLVS